MSTIKKYTTHNVSHMPVNITVIILKAIIYSYIRFSVGNFLKLNTLSLSSITIFLITGNNNQGIVLLILLSTKYTVN